MAEVTNKTGVREAAGDLNVGKEVYERVEEKAQEVIEEAAERAEANGRKTVKARDV